MTTKQDWIIENYDPAMSIPEWVSWANTPVLVANPAPQGTVPKPVSIESVAIQLQPNDRRLLKNEGTYQSLLINLNKNNFPAAQIDLQDLQSTPSISQSAVNILYDALQETFETIPDPNWQPQVWLTPAQQAGFDTALVNEVEEAIA